MTITLGSIFSWDAIAGAHYDVQVLAIGAGGGTTEILPPTDVGPINAFPLETTMTGRPGGAYRLQVRSKNPDGTLPSAFASIDVTLVGFPAPTNLSVS